MAAIEWYTPHPYGVFPRGNAYASGGQPDDSKRYGGLDEPLARRCLGFADAATLCRLGRVSSSFYVLTSEQDTWRKRYVARCAAAHGDVAKEPFEANWKTTALRLLEPAAKAAAYRHAPLRVSRPFYNDEMFQAWLCTTMPPDWHEPSLAEQKSKHPASRPLLRTVDKRAGLTPDEFRAQYEAPGLPVILTDVATEWPIFKALQRAARAPSASSDGTTAHDASEEGAAAAQSAACFENLFHRRAEIFRPEAADAVFRCEALLMPVGEYVRYAQRTVEERPFYLFDPDFAASLKEGMFSVPEHFARDDLFAALPGRPNHRWLIAGPKRSGSSFHVDPNFTSAWNANLVGRKRWLLFPPNTVPPGVHPSKDMADVTTPVSLTEWFMNYYDATVGQIGQQGYEVICEAGETVFVPAGWWHTVINLEDSVAITQNFVSACNLHKVLTFLRHMPHCISGIGEEDAADKAALARTRAAFCGVFGAAVKLRRPDLAAVVDKFEAGDAAAAEARRKGKRQREEAVKALVLPEEDRAGDDGAGGFCFSF
jgi:hypothetical protein